MIFIPPMVTKNSRWYHTGLYKCVPAMRKAWWGRRDKTLRTRLGNILNGQGVLFVAILFSSHTHWSEKYGTALSKLLFVMSLFWNRLMVIWKDQSRLCACNQIILRSFQIKFRMQPVCSLWQSTVNVHIIKLFCELHSMLLLLPTAAILYNFVAHKKKGKCLSFNSYPVNTFFRQR